MNSLAKRSVNFALADRRDLVGRGRFGLFRRLSYE